MQSDKNVSSGMNRRITKKIGSIFKMMKGIRLEKKQIQKSIKNKKYAEKMIDWYGRYIPTNFFRNNDKNATQRLRKILGINLLKKASKKDDNDQNHRYSQRYRVSIKKPEDKSKFYHEYLGDLVKEYDFGESFSILVYRELLLLLKAFPESYAFQGFVGSIMDHYKILEKEYQIKN
jgi:hypothetical protein